jgi:hypothetical protein
MIPGGGGGPMFGGSPAQVRAHLDLAALTAEAKAEYGAAVADLDRSMEHFRRLGLVLKKVKAVLPHGTFTPWVEKNMPCGERQCRRYMALADLDAGADLRERFLAFCGNAPAKRSSTSVLGPDADGDPGGQAEDGPLDSPKRSPASILGPQVGAAGEATPGPPPADDAYHTNDGQDGPWWEEASLPAPKPRPAPSGQPVPAGDPEATVAPEGAEGKSPHRPRVEKQWTAEQHRRCGIKAFGIVARAAKALGFFDEVRRELDDIIGRLRRAGKRG